MVAQLSEEQQRSINKELWESAKYGDMENVKGALQKGATFKCCFDIRDDMGSYFIRTTPHTVAYINGHNTIVQLLENAGVTPNYDEIMLAASVRGLLDIVKEAIEKGANVNNQHLDRDNDSALHLASGNGHTETVQFLLLSKADPNVRNKYGETPAHVATQQGHVDALKLLIEVGHVDVNITNSNGQTPAHFATQQGHVDALKLLIEVGHVDVNITDSNGQTPAHVATQQGHVDALKLLIEVGHVDVNITNSNGQTPAHFATQQGHVDALKLLIEVGHVDVNITNSNGWTALHYAASYNHPEIIKILITNGADITAVDKNGMTAAELAQSRGYRDIAKLIIDEALLQRLFRRGIYKGNVQLTNIRLVLMGPPCVGKTAFKSLLFNWSAPRFHNSTALATRPVQAFERVAGCNEGKIWERVTSLDLLRMLSDAIHALEQDSQHETDDPISDDDSEAESHKEPTTDETNITGLTKPNVKSYSAALPSPTAVTSTISEKYFNELDSDIDATVQPNQSEKEAKVITTAHLSSSKTTISSDEATRPAVSRSSPSKELSSHNIDMKSNKYAQDLANVFAQHKKIQNRHKATWINVLDSGGQPQFADVSRAFIHGNTINIICTKLTESLFEKPQFCYSLNGKLLNQPSELQMNNLQLIEHFVRSIVSSKNALVVKGKKSLPLFMIIGTCYDKITGVRKVFYESLEFKNEQLLSTLSEFHDYFIFPNDDPKKLIFPVDNLCWWNRKKISSSLRQHIMSYQKEIAIAAPIPVRWYMFELRLKEEASQEDHGIISLESCCGIGVSLGMDGNDVKKSLSHLHTMALFLYFPIVLRNVVFTNPQYLLDMLSSLIRVSFIDSLEDILLEGKSIALDTQRAFREFGVFEESLLDSVCLPFVCSVFTKHAFLMLLRYLHIITPLSTTDGVKRYFMPVVLPPQQAKQKDIVPFQTKCDPMIITFRSNIVPQGMFPAVVVALVDRTESPQFDIDSPRQLRYAVLLYSEDLFGSVLLVDRFYWIEVYYNGLSKNCFKLHKVICEAISACTDILAYDEGAVKAEVTVPCKQEHIESGYNLHPVIISWDDDPPSMRCSIEKQLPTLELTDERQTCWLIDPMSTSRKATERGQPNLVKSDEEHKSEDELAVISVSSTLPNGPLNECHLSALVKHIKEVDNWDILGIHLGVKNDVIKDIKALNHSQPAPSRKDLLVTWLKSGHANRADFIKALKAIGQHHVVQEILSQNDDCGASLITECENIADISINIENKLDLIRLLFPIAHKWRKIGEALSIKYGDLENFCVEKSDDADRLSAVIQKWFDQKTSPLKWSTIITAVELPPVNEHSVAESIMEKCLLIEQS